MDCLEFDIGKSGVVLEAQAESDAGRFSHYVDWDAYYYEGQHGRRRVNLSTLWAAKAQVFVDQCTAAVRDEMEYGPYDLDT